MTMVLTCVGWVGVDFEPLPLKRETRNKNFWRKTFAVSNYIFH